MNELILQAKSDDKKAMAELIESNAKLIWSIVRRFSNRNCELEDLYEIGCIGFIKAIKRFDLTYETQLSTYAVPMIIGEIKRFFRDNGPIKVSRQLKETATKVRELHEKTFRETGEDLTIEKLSETLSITKEEIVLALEATSYIDSIDRKITNDDDSTIADTLSDNSNDYEKIINNITIEQLINVLEENERKVILLRYYKEMTQTQIAKILNTSQVQVSRIEKRAIAKMRDKIEK